jgi:hypothetical protein
MQENGLESNRLIQMCIITKDGDRINRNWANLLGFDYTGLAVYDQPGKNVPTWYHGKWYQTSGIASNAVDLVEDGKWMQFEVLQAKNGPSEWNDFMQVRSGIHHVAFEVGDQEKGLAQIEKHSGRKAIQKGATFMDAESNYAYLDTKKGMGTTIELLGFGKRLEQVHEYRDLMTKMDLQGNDNQRPLAGKIPCALTLITDNEEKMAEKYKKFLDAAPEFEGVVSDTVKGTEGFSSLQRYKKAIFNLETTKLEILEPDNSKTVWTGFESKWTDGIFGMCFESVNLDFDIAKLSKFNLKPVQYGATADYKYVILDGQEDYCTMIELRTSDQIAAKQAAIAKARAERSKRFGAGLKFNLKTGLGHILDNPEALQKLKQYSPAAAAIISRGADNKTSKRIPLGFVLYSIPGIKEEDVQKIIKAINEE